MSIGLGQLIIIIILIIILFGKFPKLMDDLTKGINNFKKGVSSTEETKQISSKKDKS